MVSFFTCQILPGLKRVANTSGSRTSGDPPAVWAVKRVVTVRIQAALMPRPAPHRSGGRRLIAGQPHYHHPAPCAAHFCPAPSVCFIVGFPRCQWVRACCCSPNVSIPARRDWACSPGRSVTRRGGGVAAPPLCTNTNRAWQPLPTVNTNTQCLGG